MNIKDFVGMFRASLMVQSRKRSRMWDGLIVDKFSLASPIFFSRTSATCAITYTVINLYMTMLAWKANLFKSIQYWLWKTRWLYTFNVILGRKKNLQNCKNLSLYDSKTFFIRTVDSLGQEASKRIGWMQTLSDLLNVKT